MVFASNVFLFLFLPAFLAVYYAAPARWRSWIIALGSYVFYGWWRPDFLTLVLFSTVVDYTCGQRIAQEHAAGRKGKPWVTLSVLVNLGLLGYFKYANFGVDSLNALLGGLGLEPMAWTQVVLPVGISFYTFQTMSYTIDVYRGKAPPVRSFRDFTCYVALFPQLVAGPIVRYNSVAEQLHSRTHSFEKFSEGALRFMVGFCKKVLVADTVAPLVDAAFALPDPSLADAWLGALAYTLQLYFDFSGYSDMAIGLGLMMGFRFPENFEHPYISRNITEFWQRWHISLSTWLRDYLYIPLGGNRHGPRRTYVNLALVMLLGGLWHGANWTFLIWGAWHGGILAIERRFSRKEGRRRVVRPLPVPFVMLLVILGWVIFRAPDVGVALTMYGGMLGLNGLAVSDAMAWQVGAWPMTMLVMGFIIVYVEPRWRRLVAEGHGWQRWELSFVPLFALALLRLSAQSYTPFLYFQF
ncbi:MAG: MBOAT family protein [Alphaproteobacteria bacterium]|nr:MBOAT family protein [Alphaproteobacteria bacterium]